MTTRRVREEDVRRFHEALRRTPVRQGRFEHLMRRVIRASCRIVDWRIDVDFADALPAASAAWPGAGCVVACAPHRTWLEPFLLLAAWPPDAARLVWLADGATVTRSWWRRRILPRIGIIPIVGRPGAVEGYLEAAAAALGSGAALVVFPEKGPPSPADQTRRIAPGFAYLARRAGAPVIPVVAAGSHAVGRGSRFSVTFLESLPSGAADPEPLAQGAGPGADALAERFSAVVNAELPRLNALTDAQRPARQRWRWLGRLFH